MRKRVLLIVISAFLLLIGLGTVFVLTTHIGRSDSDNRAQVEAGTEPDFKGQDFGLYNSLFGRVGTISFDNVSVISYLNPDIIGDYDVTYQVKYLFWSYEYTDTISVVDTTPPVITLDGDLDITMSPVEEFMEPGFTAKDAYDGDVTGLVETSIDDDTVTYSVTDSSGNTATANRHLTIVDTQPPVIELTGEDVNIYQGTSYHEPGYVAYDDVDGDITESVATETDLDINTLGDYTYVYRVRDAAGNLAVMNRQVHVVDNPNKVVQPVASNGKTIYLTFDDGPSEYTPELLDILDKYNVKATFFVVNHSDYNYLLKRIADSGHTIGIHSYTHSYAMIYTGIDAYYQDLNAERQVIIDNAGVVPTIFRFPGGSSNTVSERYCQGIMHSLATSLTDDGYQYFDWNVSSGDAGVGATTESVLANIMNGIQTYNNSIVLQHDTKKFSIDAVETIIRYGLENGYEFKTLSNDSYVVHHGIQN